jgi:hypothetical protein
MNRRMRSVVFVQPRDPSGFASHELHPWHLDTVFPCKAEPSPHTLYVPDQFNSKNRSVRKKVCCYVAAGTIL